MSDFLTFMAAPAVGCLTMSVLFTYLGNNVLKRGIVFIDLSMAQLAALGTTVAFAINLEEHSIGTHLLSLCFVILGAAFIAGVRLITLRISQEAIIGIVYVVTASLAVIIADRSPRAAEHIQHTLNGSILWLSWSEAFQMIVIFLIIGCILWATRTVTGPSMAPPSANDPNSRKQVFWDFVFYLMLGLTIIACIETAGIFLIFTLLIIPAACGIQLFDGLRKQLAAGIITGIMVSLAGLAFSFNSDTPTGPTLVCAFGLAFLAVLGASALTKK